jgi:hypothetical protein
VASRHGRTAASSPSLDDLDTGSVLAIRRACHRRNVAAPETCRSYETTPRRVHVKRYPAILVGDTVSRVDPDIDCRSRRSASGQPG